MNVWNALKVWQPKKINGTKLEWAKKQKQTDLDLKILKRGTCDQIIEHLRKLTEIQQFNAQPYLQRRRAFNKKKWKYYKKWKTCAACKKESVQHIHHLVMLKNGGTNRPENLIGLCRVCHCAIHDWMEPRNEDMVNEIDREYLRVAG